MSSDGERDEPSTSTINISSLPFGVGPYGWLMLLIVE